MDEYFLFDSPPQIILIAENEKYSITERNILKFRLVKRAVKSRSNIKFAITTHNGKSYYRSATKIGSIDSFQELDTIEIKFRILPGMRVVYQFQKIQAQPAADFCENFDIKRKKLISQSIEISPSSSLDPIEILEDFTSDVIFRANLDLNNSCSDSSPRRALAEIFPNDYQLMVQKIRRLTKQSKIFELHSGTKFTTFNITDLMRKKIESIKICRTKLIIVNKLDKFKIIEAEFEISLDQNFLLPVFRDSKIKFELIDIYLFQLDHINSQIYLRVPEINEILLKFISKNLSKI